MPYINLKEESTNYYRYHFKGIFSCIFFTIIAHKQSFDYLFFLQFLTGLNNINFGSNWIFFNTVGTAQQ